MSDKSLHHSFDTDLAKKFGLHEAILIHHFQFWIQFNMNRNKHKHEDRTWTYGSYVEIAKHFSYLSAKQVRTTIESLIKKNVIMKSKFNKLSYDNTSWYAFVNEENYTDCPKRQEGLPKKAGGQDQKGKPIPDTKTDSKKDKNPPTPQKGESASDFSDSHEEDSQDEKEEYGPDGLVKLTMKQYETLLKLPWGHKVDELIEELALYIGSSGKRYKSHFYTLQDWYARKQKEKKEKTQGSKRDGSSLKFEQETDTWTPPGWEGK